MCWPCVRKSEESCSQDKVNVSKDPLEQNSRTSEHVNIATEHVSCSLIHHVQAYLSSKSNAKGKDTIIIDSGATPHMVPHGSWFHSYTPLSTPHTVTLGNDSTAYAIGTGSVVMQSVVNGKTYDITLSNVLLIPEFHLSLISVHCLSSVGLSCHIHKIMLSATLDLHSHVHQLWSTLTQLAVRTLQTSLYILLHYVPCTFDASILDSCLGFHPSCVQLQTQLWLYFSSVSVFVHIWVQSKLYLHI